MKLTAQEDEILRKALRHCSVSTYQAARQFRETGDTLLIRSIIIGILEQYSLSGLDQKSSSEAPLHLANDLGIDSLSLLEVALIAEEVFQLSINNSELLELTTLEDTIAFFERQLGGAVCQNKCSALVA